jgi:hypothetical protein
MTSADYCNCKQWQKSHVTFLHDWGQTCPLTTRGNGYHQHSVRETRLIGINDQESHVTFMRGWGRTCPLTTRGGGNDHQHSAVEKQTNWYRNDKSLISHSCAAGDSLPHDNSRWWGCPLTTRNGGTDPWQLEMVSGTVPWQLERVELSKTTRNGGAVLWQLEMVGLTRDNSTWWVGLYRDNSKEWNWPVTPRDSGTAPWQL